MNHGHGTGERKSPRFLRPNDSSTGKQSAGKQSAGNERSGIDVGSGSAYRQSTVDCGRRFVENRRFRLSGLASAIRVLAWGVPRTGVAVIF